MRVTLGAAALAVCLCLMSPRTARSWRVDLPGSGGGPSQANVVAVDALGDVIVCGEAAASDGFRDFAVVKLTGAGGGIVWTRVFRTAAQDGRCQSIAIDHSGDVFVAGLVPQAIGASGVTVAKLAGQSGSVLWRRDENTSDPTAGYVVVNDVGDALVGYTRQTSTRFAVLSEANFVRYDGVTGMPIWRWTPQTGVDGLQGGVSAVTLGVSGDLLAGTYYYEAFSLDPLAGGGYGRVSAATGVPVLSWNPPFFEGAWSGPAHVRIDGAGGVVAAGAAYHRMQPGSEFGVARTDEATGTTGWARTIAALAGQYHHANDVVGLPGGDVVAVGLLIDATGGKSGAVRLASADGAEIWRAASVVGEAQAVALDAGSDLIVTGALRDHADLRTGFGVAKLSAADGSESWRTVLAGAAAPDGERGLALANGLGGTVIAAGWTGMTASRQLTVVTLDAATGISSAPIAPLCASGVPLHAASVAVAARSLVDGSASIKANLPFAAGSPATVDPSTQGIQVRVEDVGAGLAQVVDLSDASQPIPPGAAPTPRGRAR